MPYKSLIADLDVATVRELEDLVIDACYEGECKYSYWGMASLVESWLVASLIGLLQAKLDQVKGSVYVTRVYRDVIAIFSNLFA